MKKALLAVLIPSLLGATSAFAGGIDLIKNDDMTLNFNGDVDFKWYVVDKASADDADLGSMEVIFDDIDFDFTYNVNDQLKIISGIDLTADGSDSSAGTPVETAYAWVGFKTTDFGTISFGSQTLSYDPFGIDNSEMYTGMASGDTDGGGTDSDNSIKYEIEFGDVLVSTSYQLPSDGTFDETTQLVLTYDANGLEVMAGYGRTIQPDGHKGTYMQAQVEFETGDFTAAVLVSQEDAETTEVVTNGVEVDFSYQVASALKLSVGAELLTQDIEGVTTNDDLMTAYVAAKYKISSNTSILAEIGRKDGDFQKFGATSVSSSDENKAGFLLNLQF